MVNACLDQSVETPSFLSWVVILPPYCSFHSQTFSTNFSRPRSCLVLPSSFMRFFSTTTYGSGGGRATYLSSNTGVVDAGDPEGLVAAHSLPRRSSGGGDTYQRVMVSSMALVRAWPR